MDALLWASLAETVSFHVKHQRSNCWSTTSTVERKNGGTLARNFGYKIDVSDGHTKLMDQQVQEVQDSIEVSLESKIEADQVRKVFLQNPPVQEQQQKIRFRRETFERFWDLHSRFLPGCFRCLAGQLTIHVPENLLPKNLSLENLWKETFKASSREED